MSPPPRPHRSPRSAGPVRPHPGPGRVARFVLAVLLVTAQLAAGCAALDERLRQAVFRPSRDVPAAFDGLRPGDRIWRETVGDPTVRDEWVQLWWLPAADPAAPALLYLHGTFRNLYRNHPKMQAIRDAGYSVLAVEYRGWGDASPLVPSEDSVTADARAGWRELVRRQPDPRRRVIFGHSMGSGAAVALAAGLPAGEYGGVVLESAFARAADVAVATSRLLAPLTWVRDLGFDSAARIGSVRAPILMLHGTADTTVPIDLGRALFEAAPAPRRFVAIEGGGHSRLQEDDVAGYRQALQDFARRLATGR